ncbi:MAG: SGNH/GDSL hydrolase family protein [Roseburia sp.]
MKKKRWMAALLVLVILSGALYGAQRLLVPKYQTGIVEGSMIEEYYQDESDHEVIMIGDCEVYENISTIELWEKYGITSYIRGSAQQLTWQSYYLLEDTLRYETPKVVVFNVLALKYDTPQSEAYNRMSIDGMRWSSSKVKNIQVSMTEEEHFIEYVFPLLRYHARWSELNSDDTAHWFSKDLVTHNGYYMRVDTKAQGEFPDPTPLADYTLGENAMGYLQKMADLCQEKGIKLVLIKAPTEYPYWYEQWDEQVEAFAEENNLDYINFIPLQEEIGLDMSEDTYDAGLHLNTRGAEKMADYFGQWLVENCDLTDYRNQEEYAKIWGEKVEFYNEMKEQQYAELEEYGELRSFGANAIVE